MRFIDIFHMFGDCLAMNIKQLRHLRLCQPYSFIFYANFDVKFTTLRLINNNFVSLSIIVFVID